MDSFNPRVECPYCGCINKPSITGWGSRELNTRLHNCKMCHKEYTVVIYTEASKDYQISAMHLAALRARIVVWKQQIREMESNLVSEATGLAKEYLRAEASTCGKQN